MPSTAENEALDKLFDKGLRHDPDAKWGKRDLGDGSSYTDGRRIKERVRSRLRRVLSNDISPIPFETVNEERRDSCKFNLQLFCETYFANRFDLRWSPEHLKLFSTIQEAVLSGVGYHAYAFPRGSGKTSIAECAAFWADLYNHRQYCVLVSATESVAKHAFNSFIEEFENNEILNEDFPHVCYPIRILEGVWKRANLQSYEGRRVKFAITKDLIKFPTIEGYECNGNILQSVSIGKGFRGFKVSKANGKQIRPDLVIVDDPQTDSVARSPSKVHHIEKIINGAIRGLAGPGKPITIIMPCTVIRRDDVAERFLDRDKRPEWQGHKVKWFDSFPVNMDLWKAYYDIRIESFKAGRKGVDGNEFYIKNREEMDKGAKVYWEDRYNPLTEISAIQAGMNLYFVDPLTFASEYQNEPLPDTPTGERPRIDLLASNIMDRFSGRPLGTIPLSTQHITTGVDIQAKLIYYVTTAWTPDFGGVILDWGTFPKQKEDYFLDKDAAPGFDDVFPGQSLGPQIYAALENLVNGPINHEFTVDGNTFAKNKVERVFVDANWNITSESVFAFTQKYETRGVWATIGAGISASGLPMDQWAKRDHEVKGLNWLRRPATPRGNRGKHYTFDTNFWKSLVAERLVAPTGSKNALLLPGHHNSKYQLLADHLSSEYPTTTFGRNRYIDEWKQRPGTNNHFFDCLILSAVAASTCGLSPHAINTALDGLSSAVAPPKVRKVIPIPPPKRRY